MSQLVTGDAVVLGLRPAKLPSRALAIMIDLAVLWTTYVLLTVSLLGLVSGLDSAASAAVSVAALLLVLMGVPVAVETLSDGRSLGKVVCGLRVVREDGGPIRFRHALARGAIGFLELQLTFGVLAVTASLVSGRGRRLGDVFGGTLVVRERTAVSSPASGVVPPAPTWVSEPLAGLDLSAVPDSLWLAVRQYLLRGAELDPQVGDAMAARLADDLARLTGVPAPSGMPPSTYLAGVLAERRSRDVERSFEPRRWRASPSVGHGDAGGPQKLGGPAAGRPVEDKGAGTRTEGSSEPRRATGFVPPA